MEVLSLVPVHSPLHDAERVQRVVHDVVSLVSRSPGYSLRVKAPREVGTDEEALFLVVTGGTEQILLEVLEKRRGPVVLLAHPGQNSLPAALEVVARLRAEGGSPYLAYLSEDGSQALEQLGRTLRLVLVYRWMHSARLGLIGAPSEWLVASSPDPVLVTRVWGPEVVPVEIEEILECLGRVGSRQAAAVKEDFLAGAALVREPSPDDLDRAAAVYVALRQIVDERGLDALTVRCFDLLRLAGTTGCLALSRLNDEGVVAGCEGDLPATLTMMLLSRLCGEPAFMGNPARIDDRAERVWIAHCTVARALVSSYVLRSHFESGIGVAIEGELRTGRVTIARIGGSRLSELLLEPGTVEASGHEEDLCRTQACVRSLSAVVVLLRSPLGNHHVLAYGDWVREAQALAHLARWAVR